MLNKKQFYARVPAADKRKKAAQWRQLRELAKDGRFVDSQKVGGDEYLMMVPAVRMHEPQEVPNWAHQVIRNPRVPHQDFVNEEAKEQLQTAVEHFNAGVALPGSSEFYAMHMFDPMDSGAFRNA